MRGRPPKPTQLKIIAGNPGKRPLPADEPKLIPLNDDDPPESMYGAVSRKKWRELIGDLRKMGIIGTSDRETLARYCEEYETYRKALSKVRREGLTTAAGDAHPLLRVVDQCMGRMIPLLRELGMTPAARSRVSAIEKAGRGSDEWDDLDEGFERTA